MNCTSCGAPLDERGVDLDAGTARCFSCGHVDTLSVGGATPAVSRLPQPAGTRVVLDRRRPGEIVLSVPSKGGCGLLIAAAMFLGVSTVLAVGIALSKSAFLMLLFLVPFWLGGIAMLVFGLFSRYGITGVYLDRTRYMVAKQLWGRGWTRRGAIEDVDSITISEAYRQNERPVMAVTLHVGRKTIKFGSFLSDEEKRWIVSELRAFMAEIGRPLAW